MSTSVTPEDWPQLEVVHPKMWRGSGLRCDHHPDRAAQEFMQTPDHRAVALCGACVAGIRRALAGE